MAKDCITLDEFEKKYGRIPDGETADDVRNRAKEQIKKDKENLAKNIKIQKALTSFLDSAKNPEEALVNLLRPDRINKSGGLGTTALEFEQDTVMFQAHSDLMEMMQEYKPFLGVKPITDSDPKNLVRVLYGESVDDVYASKFAEMWTKAVNKLVDRYNAAGGRIEKTGDWNLPQVHSTIKVASVDREEWVSYIWDKLDFKKMRIDRMAKVKQHKILSDVYDTIATNGLNKGVKDKKVSLANRRNNERFLQFKDADSWLDYQGKFGNDNVYASMMDYINGLSKDIGAMEKFGSDPEAMFEFLSDYAVKKSPNPVKASNRVLRAKRIWDNTMGHTSAQDTKFAHVGSSIRNVMTATKLGSAILSAFSDISLLAVTSAFNGMSVTKPIFRMLANIANGKTSDTVASRLLLGMEHAIDASHTASRYSDVVGHGATAKFADFVIRSSGLNHWTVSGKQAFGVEFIAHITQAIKKGEGVKIFKTYGISKDDISKLKKAKTFTDGKVELLEIQSLPVDLQKKMVAMTLSETRMAIPEPDMGVKAILNQGSKSGTWIGEVFRSGTQFKSFPATMITGHLARMWNQTGGTKGRLAYGASLIAGTTIMGVFATVAKDVAVRGERPTRDSMNAALLFKGFVQGGSGAFVVDLLASNASPGFFKTGLADTLAGPTAGYIDRVLFDIVFGEGKKLAAGKKDPDKAAIAVLAKQLEMTVPNLPFVKLAIQREVLSHMHKAGDNKWQRKQRQYQRKRMKETNNKYWYKP